MQVPRLKAIYINKGIGKFINDKKFITLSVKELSMISGQKAVLTKAKKSISNFKLREGMSIGIKVTLHNKKMYEFFDRLITLALPRVRDFQGLDKKSFDGKGNYNLGVKEQIIFPEIKIDQINKLSGMNITIITSAQNDKDGYELLKAMGMPFKK
jgi:large subunit ribosomal protein L5